jgi:hypothetical protein
MYTSIVLAALMGPGAAPFLQASEGPSWQKNYSAACKLGRQQNKPLAIFVASGPAGWDKVSQESTLTPAVRKLLADSFVCVYLDAGETHGKRLAEAFELTHGLVVSTRDGESQAFRHSGRISSKDLASTLRRYSNGHRSIRTETLQSQQSNRSTTSTRAASSYTPTFSFGASGGGSC